mmetsp:Transcript_252/g.449  ORF Transcript_252/g.449 Transcript_252/m.449 type:complete len:152 (-) Transcript_252:346-801(-)|eukprot:CAMPEP_0202428092 /NCGR_PEP_ID=MMETSP1345-20130828/2172_1 /ASSEMBLY_ACC=CAM_ASM_000843 /TAXON_ID=342563 /ORGANISM="Fabrea Fabrea salina" /LENGTH=151 /DNA_ID=CAMNT_0049038977 /DNA_START=775 /DNA_END=1230 /DNA_ORIENTATION=-
MKLILTLFVVCSSKTLVYETEAHPGYEIIKIEEEPYEEESYLVADTRDPLLQDSIEDFTRVKPTFPELPNKAAVTKFSFRDFEESISALGFILQSMSENEVVELDGLLYTKENIQETKRNYELLKERLEENQVLVVSSEIMTYKEFRNKYK